MTDIDSNGPGGRRPPRFGERSVTGNDRFDYRPGQPNLYMMMRLKQALVKDHGVDAGFDRYRSEIPRQSDAVLERRVLRSHHAHSLAAGLRFHEIFPAGETVAIDPPRVIGPGDHYPLRGTTRSFYLSCLENACVRGRSAITEVDQLALADFQGQELARIDDELEFDSGVFHRDGNEVWLVSDQRPPMEFETALSLLGGRTDFFGDWLVDYIPRYVAATMEGILPEVPILIDACMPASHRQALELMAPGKQPTIIEVPAFTPVRIGRLWQASSIAYMPFHQVLNGKFRWEYNMSSSERFLPVEEEMGRRADRHLDAKPGPSRVFLARRPTRHRKMINHEEIEAIAAAHGFEIVYPEDLDFRAQAKLLRDARFVLGPEGSAFFLMAFLRPGARLCILNHEETHSLTLYNWADGLKDQVLTIISGPEAGERKGRSLDMDYIIDPVVVRDFLREWLP